MTTTEKKVIKVEEAKAFATDNAATKTVVMKNGQYVRVKLGFAKRVWDKSAKGYSCLQEDGFTLQKMSDGTGLYVIVGNTWFTATKSNRDGGIELNYKSVKPNGLSQATFDMRSGRNVNLHLVAREYLLNAQNFKTMKYKTLYDAYLKGCREEEAKQEVEENN